MKNSLSLRVRLILIILTPLILIAALVGAWAYFDAKTTAAERFDRSLLSTALAISRDIAVTGGDALSEDTRDLFINVLLTPETLAWRGWVMLP